MRRLLLRERRNVNEEEFDEGVQAPGFSEDGVGPKKTSRLRIEGGLPAARPQRDEGPRNQTSRELHDLDPLAAPRASEVEVGQDGGVVRSAEALQRCGQRVRLVDVVAAAAQRAVHEAEQRGIVVDDKDPRGLGLVVAGGPA